MHPRIKEIISQTGGAATHYEARYATLTAIWHICYYEACNQIAMFAMLVVVDHTVHRTNNEF